MHTQNEFSKIFESKNFQKRDISKLTNKKNECSKKFRNRCLRCWTFVILKNVEYGGTLGQFESNFILGEFGETSGKIKSGGTLGNLLGRTVGAGPGEPLGPGTERRLYMLSKHPLSYA